MNMAGRTKSRRCPHCQRDARKVSPCGIFKMGSFGHVVNAVELGYGALSRYAVPVEPSYRYANYPLQDRSTKTNGVSNFDLTETMQPMDFEGNTYDFLVESEQRTILYTNPSRRGMHLH
jgi:hypothetical protein